MNNVLDKIVCIVGPTASGKTDLAFDLSHYFPGELVNADSKQVYTDIDIIPGKDIPSDAVFVPSTLDHDHKYSIGYYTFDEVRIWLLDIVPPTQSLSVYDFIQIAPPILSYIQENNRIPLIVGGSGFYVKALLDGIETLSIPQDNKLRKDLEDTLADELFVLLQKKDPQRAISMNESDRKNKRRLIRAIEVAEFIMQHKKAESYLGLKSDVKVIGLSLGMEKLRQRIDERITKRIKQGALEEAQRLFEKKGILSETVKNIKGVLPLFSYFEGKSEKNDAIDAWRRSEYLNAKKQMTWFRKDPRIIWYDVSEGSYKDRIIDDLRNWLKYETRTEF